MTTRSVGANYGADLCEVLAYDEDGRPVQTVPMIGRWSIECKNEGKWRPDAWLSQARRQMMPGSKPLVLAKRRNHPNLEAWVVMEHPEYKVITTTLRRWLAAERGT